MGKNKTLDDYRELAEEFGIEYTAPDIPEKTTILVDGWKCSSGHLWKSSYTYMKVKNVGCPICNGTARGKKTVQDYINAAVEHGGTYIKDSVPRSVNDKTDGWKCENGHTWEARYAHVKYNNSWCPVCTKESKCKYTLQDYKDIAKEKGGSFESEIVPTKSSVSMEGWKCGKCEHTWSTSYQHIRDGTWCIKCAFDPYRITLDEYKNLAIKRGGEYILDIIPENSSCDIEGWKCSEGHIWSANYHRIASRFCWCPECGCKSSVGEIVTKSVLEKMTDMPFRKARINGFELDGYNSDLKIAFEYQGQQHYYYVEYFHRTVDGFERQKIRDRNKSDMCKANDITLLCIPYQYRDQDEIHNFVVEELDRLGTLIFSAHRN